MNARRIVLLGWCGVFFAGSFGQLAQAQISNTIIAGQTVWYDSGSREMESVQSVQGGWSTVVNPVLGGELALVIRANESLRQRAEALESEVLRLRADLQRLSLFQNGESQESLRKQECEARLERRERQVVCTVKTPFNGIFVGRADTRLEASAQVLQKCEQSGAGFCPEKSVQCESPSR